MLKLTRPACGRFAPCRTNKIQSSLNSGAGALSITIIGTAEVISRTFRKSSKNAGSLIILFRFSPKQDSGRRCCCCTAVRGIHPRQIFSDSNEEGDPLTIKCSILPSQKARVFFFYKNLLTRVLGSDRARNMYYCSLTSSKTRRRQCFSAP